VFARQSRAKMVCDYSGLRICRVSRRALWVCSMAQHGDVVPHASISDACMSYEDDACCGAPRLHMRRMHAVVPHASISASREISSTNYYYGAARLHKCLHHCCVSVVSHAWLYIYKCIYIFMYVYVYVCICICMYMYIYIYPT